MVSALLGCKAERFEHFSVWQELFSFENHQIISHFFQDRLFEKYNFKERYLTEKL